MHTVQCKLNSAHWQKSIRLKCSVLLLHDQHNALYTLHYVHPKLHTTPFTMHTAHCKLINGQCTMYTEHCTHECWVKVFIQLLPGSPHCTKSFYTVSTQPILASTVYTDMGVSQRNQISDHNKNPVFFLKNASSWWTRAKSSLVFLIACDNLKFLLFVSSALCWNIEENAADSKDRSR